MKARKQDLHKKQKRGKRNIWTEEKFLFFAGKQKTDKKWMSHSASPFPGMQAAEREREREKEKRKNLFSTFFADFVVSIAEEIARK